MLDALVSTEMENERIEETQEKARYEAQETAISAAWGALIAIVDWHTACAVADRLRPDPA